MKYPAIVFCLLFSLSAINCGSHSSAQSNNRVVNSTANGSENSKSNAVNAAPELTSEETPMILYGGFHLRDARKSFQTTLEVDLRGEDVAATVKRGVEVKFPPVGATVKMDVMNCAGFLGIAEVKFQGRDKLTNVWTAELINESKVPDLEAKLLQCVEKPNEELTRKYPFNQVYFVAPTDEKRKQITNVQTPDWKTILPNIPEEFRQSAKLSKQPTAEQINDCIGNWLDSDGDGAIDVLTLCAFNEKSRTENDSAYQFQRVLRLTNGKWREIWQTVDTKD